MGARYYDGQVGRFNSQDPVALALGNTKLVEQKVELPFEAYLKVPQAHNSYSYALNNPVTVDDSTGESSLRAWLTPGWNSLTAVQVGVGKLGSIGLYMAGRPASAELFSHSLNLNPGPVNIGSNSTIANSIIGSESYTSQLNQGIADNPNGGNFVVEFKPQGGDAKTAVGRFTFNVSVSPNDNGSYNVRTTGTNEYNFGFNTGDYKSPLGTAANVAYFGQQTEAVSTFDMVADFEHEYRPENKRKKDEN